MDDYDGCTWQAWFPLLHFVAVFTEIKNRPPGPGGNVRPAHSKIRPRCIGISRRCTTGSSPRPYCTLWFFLESNEILVVYMCETLTDITSIDMQIHKASGQFRCRRR